MLASANPRPLSRSLVVPYVLSAFVIILLVVASVGGLLFGRSLYDAKTFPAFVGQDVISLVLGLPFLVVSLWLARRGSTRGLLLWMGSQFYIAYGYAYYVFGAQFNPLFLVYLALVSSSLYALLWSLVSVDAEAIKSRFGENAQARTVAGFLLAVGVVFTCLWVGGIVSAAASGAALDPVFRLVSTLDFTMALPPTFIGGILLWRRQAWGYVVGGLALVHVASYMLTLAGTAVLASLLGASLDSLLPIYSTVAVGGLVCTVLYFHGIESTAEQNEASE